MRCMGSMKAWLASNSGYRLTDFPGSNISVSTLVLRPVVVYSRANSLEGGRSLIWNSTNTAEFRHGIHFRQFLRRLPPLMACDVLMWSYMSYSHSLGQPVACVDLGRGSFMNAGSLGSDINCDTLVQVLSSPSFQHDISIGENSVVAADDEDEFHHRSPVVEMKKMDGCSYRVVFNSRYPSRRRKIRADYDSFGDARLWRELGC